MATLLDNKLNDDFERYDGAMVGYNDGTWPLAARRHYDLRAFHSSNIVVPFTQLDQDFWEDFKYTNYDVGDLRSVVNVSSRARLISEIDSIAMSDLNGQPMALLDTIATTSGNEEWTDDDDITLAKDSSQRYLPTLSVTLTNGVEKIVSSYYNDDILTDFQGHNWIEIVLPDFPASSATDHLDLDQSFIEFSSDQNFSSAVTDSIAFSDSENDLSTGGDTYIKFSRSLLMKADLSALKAIRFRLVSVGAPTIKFAAMRLISQDYSFEEIDVDTKRKQLVRSVPQSGAPEWTTTFGDVYFSNIKPINQRYVVMFNSGHNPASPNDNIMRLYFRRQPDDDKIEVNLSARTTQSRLSILETVSGVTSTISQTTTNTNILTEEKYYYLVCDLIDNKITVSIYEFNEVDLGDLVYTSGEQTVTLLTAGSTGYSFEPYNYDFTVQYIAPIELEFAKFISTSMVSRTPASGATLWTDNSMAINLIGDLAPSAWGDANINVSSNQITIDRSGTLNQGGIRFDPIYVGDTSQLIVMGELQTSNVIGTYRAALIDKWDRVAWIGEITNLVPNQWNTFTLSVTPNVLPELYYFHIQQTGLHDNSFTLRNLSLDYETIAWSISSNAGTAWQPFLQAINYEFSGAKFATPGTQLKLQAKANSNKAWIRGYRLDPHYLT